MRNIALLVGFVVGVIVAGCVLFMRGIIVRGSAPPRFLDGTKVELAGWRGRLQLYVAPSTDGKPADFAVFDGSDCIVSREHSRSNTIQITFGGVSSSRMVEEHDGDGKFLHRTVDFYDGSGGLNYLYVDTDNDGLWDYFFDNNSKVAYVRSNLCWIPKAK